MATKRINTARILTSLAPLKSWRPQLSNDAKIVKIRAVLMRFVAMFSFVNPHFLSADAARKGNPMYRQRKTSHPLCPPARQPSSSSPPINPASTDSQTSPPAAPTPAPPSHYPASNAPSSTYSPSLMLPSLSYIDVTIIWL